MNIKNLIKIIFICTINIIYIFSYASTSNSKTEEITINGLTFTASVKNDLSGLDLFLDENKFLFEIQLLNKALVASEVNQDSNPLIAKNISCFLKDNLDKRLMNNILYEIIHKLEPENLNKIFGCHPDLYNNTKERNNFFSSIITQKIYIDYLANQIDSYDFIIELMHDICTYISKYRTFPHNESTCLKRKRDDSFDQNQSSSDTGDLDSNDQQDSVSNNEFLESESSEKSCNLQPLKKRRKRNLNNTYTRLCELIESNISKKDIKKELNINNNTFRIYCGLLLKQGLLESAQLQYLKLNGGRIGRNDETKSIVLEWLNEVMSEGTVKPSKDNNVKNTLYPSFIEKFRMYFENDITLDGFRWLMNRLSMNNELTENQKEFYNSFKKNRGQ